MLHKKNPEELEVESDGEGHVADTELNNISLYIKKRQNFLPIQSGLPSRLINLRANDRPSPQQVDETTNKANSKVSSKSTSTSDLLKLHSNDSTATNRTSVSTINTFRSSYLEPEQTDVHRVMGKYKAIVPFLDEGLSLLKVSQKSRKRIVFQVHPTDFKLLWKVTAKASSSNGVSGFQKLIHTASAHSYKTHEITINCIKWIALQSEANNYREELHISKEFENHWLTIYYLNVKKDKLKTLHLITDTEHDFKRLSGIIETMRSVREALANNFLLGDEDFNELRETLTASLQANETVKEVRELLYFDDILKYSRRLNINLDESFLKDVFDKVVSKETISSESRGLNFEGFKEFVSILKRREDISHIWNSIFGGQVSIDFNSFRDFMINVQKENPSEESLKRIFIRFCYKEDRSSWTKESLNAYLLSKYSTVFRPNEEERYFDHPLNHYFISSSHNTYLTGRQVMGDSSIDGYIRAFQRGCKCVEIDIWDGVSLDEEAESIEGETKGPIVNHGHTFTSSISLKNVLQTVKKYAFTLSPWPVILSLEVHCNTENQIKLKKTLLDVLGDVLVLGMLKNHNELPSPQELQNKILLKIKRTGTRTYSVTHDGQSALSTSTTSTSFSEDSTASQKRNPFVIRRRSQPTKILTELSDLAIYIQGIKFRNFSLPESKTFNHCISLSEKSFNSLMNDNVKQTSVEKHNRKYLMRVYPSKLRIGSSNFNPCDFWNMGVQMVASNWQTYDVGQQINEAMFQSSGRSGYTLKPQNLRPQLAKSNKKVASMSTRTRFTVEIISALQLPKSKGTNVATNPFVMIEMHGCSFVLWDGAQDPSTLIVSANGFNPIWREKFSCVMVADNDLAFLRIVVNSSSSSTEKLDPQVLGIIVLRICLTREGYRYIPINDPLGEELVYSKLLVRIKKTEL